MDVAIVGPGNWGSSLEAALRAAKVPVAEVVGRRAVRGRITNWNRAKLDARILWLCVPDGAIVSAIEEMVRRRPDLSGQIVVHASGALTSEILDPARRAGAKIASVHPVMTFPTRDIVPLAGVLFGIETAQAATRRTLESLVRKMGGVPFTVDGKKKAVYHAAAVMASPLILAGMTAAMEAAQLAGLDEATAERWVAALTLPTVRNVAERGRALSFSGPFARGDAGTIHLHLQALAAHPILTDVYRSLAAEALAALPVKNREAIAEVLAMPTDKAGAPGLREKLKRSGSV